MTDRHRRPQVWELPRQVEVMAGQLAFDLGHGIAEVAVVRRDDATTRERDRAAAPDDTDPRVA